MEDDWLTKDWGTLSFTIFGFDFREKDRKSPGSDYRFFT